MFWIIVAVIIAILVGTFSKKPAEVVLVTNCPPHKWTTFEDFLSLKDMSRLEFLRKGPDYEKTKGKLVCSKCGTFAGITKESE